LARWDQLSLGMSVQADRWVGADSMGNEAGSIKDKPRDKPQDQLLGKGLTLGFKSSLVATEL